MRSAHSPSTGQWRVCSDAWLQMAAKVGPTTTLHRHVGRKGASRKQRREERGLVSRLTLLDSLASRSLLVVYAPLQKGQQKECAPAWQDLVAVHKAVERRRPLEQSEVDRVEVRNSERGRQTEYVGAHDSVKSAIRTRQGHVKRGKKLGQWTPRWFQLLGAASSSDGLASSSDLLSRRHGAGGQHVYCNLVGLLTKLTT